MNIAVLLRSLKKAWPLLVGAWTVYARLAKDNPELHRQVKDQVDAFAARVKGALEHQIPEERIVAMLGAAEEAATARAALGTDQQKSDARSWLRRAAGIRQALVVAEKADGRARRRMLRQLRKRTDALVAEVFESLMPEELRSTQADDEGPSGGRLSGLRKRARRLRG